MDKGDGGLRGMGWMGEWWHGGKAGLLHDLIEAAEVYKHCA